MYAEPGSDDLDTISRPRRAVGFAKSLFKVIPTVRSAAWLRLAQVTDVKVRKAAKNSRFYEEHGRPLIGKNLENTTSLGKRLGDKRSRSDEADLLDEELDRYRYGKETPKWSKRGYDADEEFKATLRMAELDAELEAYTNQPDSGIIEDLREITDAFNVRPEPPPDDGIFDQSGTVIGMRGWADNDEQLPARDRGLFPDKDPDPGSDVESDL